MNGDGVRTKEGCAWMRHGVGGAAAIEVGVVVGVEAVVRVEAEGFRQARRLAGGASRAETRVEKACGQR